MDQHEATRTLFYRHPTITVYDNHDGFAEVEASFGDRIICREVFSCKMADVASARMVGRLYESLIDDDDMHIRIYNFSRCPNCFADQRDPDCTFIVVGKIIYCKKCVPELHRVQAILLHLFT